MAGPPPDCDHVLLVVRDSLKLLLILRVPETEAVIHWSFGIFRLSAIGVDMIGRLASSRFRFGILSLPDPISQVTLIPSSPVSRHLQDEQIKVE
jgi:hypothetical protein